MYESSLSLTSKEARSQYIGHAARAMRKYTVRQVTRGPAATQPDQYRVLVGDAVADRLGGEVLHMGSMAQQAKQGESISHSRMNLLRRTQEAPKSCKPNQRKENVVQITDVNPQYDQTSCSVVNNLHQASDPWWSGSHFE